MISEYKSKVTEIGKHVVEIVDSYNGDGIGLILARYPDISRAALERLESIGRGFLLPEFALDSSVAADHIAKLPAQTQMLIIRDGVEVLKAGGVHNKPYQSLNWEECKQVFDGNHLRSIAEQRAFTRGLAKMAAKPRYSIDTELAQVIFYQQCRFSCAELEELLLRLKEIETRNLERNLKKAQIAGKR